MHRRPARVRITRRGLQLALGLIWVLDGALQYQPFMFSHGFASEVIAPAGAGNPGWVAGPVAWTAGQIGSHLLLANATFATLQLAIGLGILWPRTARLALAASVPWAVGVWWLGEGLGGVLTPAANPLTGAPGAVVIYALLAVLLWPGDAGRDGQAVAGRDGQAVAGRDGQAVAYRGPAGTTAAQVAWLVLWAALAVECLRPAYRPPNALADTVLGAQGGEPGWLAALDRMAGTALLGHGPFACVLLALALTVIAGSVLVPSITKPALVICIGLALLIWVVPENLGGIMTGAGTDPNTGPLLALLALAYWPRRPEPEPRRGGQLTGATSAGSVTEAFAPA
jgi:hypothetical protein